MVARFDNRPRTVWPRSLGSSLRRCAMFKPQLQALLILAMADRGDADAMPAMLEASKSGPSAVRIAAIKVLQSIGDASCVPVLLSIAAENDKDVAQAAKETLKMLPGKGVDADLVARLDNAKGADRLALIELIGMRRIDAYRHC